MTEAHVIKIIVEWAIGLLVLNWFLKGFWATFAVNSILKQASETKLKHNPWTYFKIGVIKKQMKDVL